jgi:hypothetical protein
MITNPAPPPSVGGTAAGATLATDLAPKLHAAAYEDDIPEISGGGDGGGGDDSPIGGGLAAMQEMSAYYQSSDGGGHYCHYSNHQQQLQQQAYSWHQQPAADYGYYNQFYSQGYGQHQMYQHEQWLQQQQHQQHQNQLVLPPGPSPTGRGPA